jgi:hypothetical protein
VDNETNSEGASSKDGGKMKVGDKVWVQVKVLEVASGSVHVSGHSRASWWMFAEHCKPVEPEAVEQTETVGPKAICVGDKVTWSGHKGVVSEWCKQTQKFLFRADNGAVVWVFESSLSPSDPVNPSHYKQGPAETIDIIEAAIAKAPNNKAAGLHWQVLKYALRCWFKNGIEDLKKARWYLDRLIKQEEAR